MTYFALRSYQDDGEHYDGQIGSEPTPADFLAALWAVTDECWRVLKPTGSLWVNLGDSYAGSGGHNNAGVGGTGRGPSRYNQATDVPVKSLRGLPWRYALGLTCPDPYRTDDVANPPQWTLRAEVIWDKPNGLPESVTDRVRRSHEQWFHLTRQGRYYAAVDEIREAYSPASIATYNAGGLPQRPDNDALHTSRQPSAYLAGGEPEAWRGNPLGKLPGSVWTIPSEPLAVPDHLGVDHFAAFPQEWVRRLVLGWSPPGICTACGEGRRPVTERSFTGEYNSLEGARQQERAAMTGGTERVTLGRTDDIDRRITGYTCACDVQLAPTRPAVVLDPFVGTGTVPMVARALGRYGVGLDLSRDYLRLATWRITSPTAHKSINRTNRERQGVLW